MGERYILLCVHHQRKDPLFLYLEQIMGLISGLEQPNFIPSLDLQVSSNLLSAFKVVFDLLRRLEPFLPQELPVLRQSILVDIISLVDLRL
jgi:hypothetical protein